ncbi:unnamed protein product [Durusdinium trenchii]|uniref:Uncharacterized protein n=1 Tax=Durusdinium trenchii TaxID=1381693 RepID=A0ABP0J1M2_9DINO
MGTSRCKRLYNAALEGADSAPVDLRFLQRPFSDKKGKKGDDVRTGFYAEALPFTLKGIGGSGAPHYFAFERRVDSGPFAFDRPKSMA